MTESRNEFLARRQRENAADSSHTRHWSWGDYEDICPGMPATEVTVCSQGCNADQTRLERMARGVE